MATKRGNIWYTKRSYPGVGKMEKSLHTPSKARGEHLERILMGLLSLGLTGVLRAFDEGKLSIHRIAESWESGAIHDLAAAVPTDSVTLAKAVEAVLDGQVPSCV